MLHMAGDVHPLKRSSWLKLQQGYRGVHYAGVKCNVCFLALDTVAMLSHS